MHATHLSSQQAHTDTNTKSATECNRRRHHHFNRCRCLSMHILMYFIILLVIFNCGMDFSCSLVWDACTITHIFEFYCCTRSIQIAHLTMRFGVYSFCHAVISSRFFFFDIFPHLKMSVLCFYYLRWRFSQWSRKTSLAWSKRHMEIKPFPKWVLRRSHAI